MARSSPNLIEAAAVCTPGLEDLCRQELAGLGCRGRPAGPGVVEFSATVRQLYAANLWLRTANRVLARVAVFRATDFAHLQTRAAEVDWSPWLGEGQAPEFRVSANQSKLYHTEAVAQRLHRVVGPPATDGQEAQGFVVRIERNTVTISADASGPPLHQRPWRTETGMAPLRPTMAAAMILAAGWGNRPTGDEPAGEGPPGLVDPFCGSGTVVIEAALLRLGRPPGGLRSFAFHRWPSFQPGTWASVTGAATSASPSSGGGVESDGEPVGVLMGSDRDPAAVAAARANAERAGVAEVVELSQGVVSHLGAQARTGLVATNPPYGRRVGDRRTNGAGRAGGNLDGLYRRLGAVARDRLPGWDLALVSPDRRLAARADRHLRPILSFGHGGIPVRVYHRPPTPTP